MPYMRLCGRYGLHALQATPAGVSVEGLIKASRRYFRLDCTPKRFGTRLAMLFDVTIFKCKLGETLHGYDVRFISLLSTV